MSLYLRQLALLTETPNSSHLLKTRQTSGPFFMGTGLDRLQEDPSLLPHQNLAR